jgi:hypothetical protein
MSAKLPLQIEFGALRTIENVGRGQYDQECRFSAPTVNRRELKIELHRRMGVSLSILIVGGQPQACPTKRSVLSDCRPLYELGVG